MTHSFARRTFTSSLIEEAKGEWLAANGKAGSGSAIV
jgi:hypothetical protein